MEGNNEEKLPIIKITSASYQSIPNGDANFNNNDNHKNTSNKRPENYEKHVAIMDQNKNEDVDYLTVSERHDKTSTKSESGSVLPENNRRSKVKRILTVVKIAMLTMSMLLGMMLMALIGVKSIKWITTASSEGEKAIFNVTTPILGFINVDLKGPFVPDKYDILADYEMAVSLKMNCQTVNSSYVLTTPTKWKVPIPSNIDAQHIPDNRKRQTYDVRTFKEYCQHPYHLNGYFLEFEANTTHPFPFSVLVSTVSEVHLNGAIYSAIILIGLYVLIGFELVHRTLAAMIASTMALTVLTVTNEKPELQTIITWLDIETLVLLFSMMLLVAILCETGLFDYVAVLAYRLAKGSQWPLITTLCLFTAIISAFLDNVTTILLITPVTIRLCEVMGLDPKHVLVAIVLFSNIGGAATPIGDPPNVIIISNEAIVKNGIDFLTFTEHVAPGIILCLITGFIFIRLYYMRGQMHFTDPPDVVDLTHEIDVWKRAYNSLPGYTHEEDVVRDTLERKIKHLEKILHKKRKNKKPNEGEYRASLKELQDKYKIRNKSLLIKSVIVLVIELCLFFASSIPDMHLTLGWIALFGAIILLILADFPEVESIFARVEWPTLVFFSALFVLMKVVEKLGLLEIISATTESIIWSFEPENQLNAAMILILWVSAIASTFIDNIPYTTAMVPVIGKMAASMNLPLQPLTWALAFGACLGGNGSLIGASANVVCAGIAENHGYRITFGHFFKIGFPMMLVTTATASVYMLLCHSVLEWNY